VAHPFQQPASIFSVFRGDSFSFPIRPAPLPDPGSFPKLDPPPLPPPIFSLCFERPGPPTDFVLALAVPDSLGVRNGLCPDVEADRQLPVWLIPLFSSPPPLGCDSRLSRLSDDTHSGARPARGCGIETLELSFPFLFSAFAVLTYFPSLPFPVCLVCFVLYGFRPPKRFCLFEAVPRVLWKHKPVALQVG